MLHRFLTRNSLGPGEIFRAAFGRPHFAFMLQNDRNLTFCFLVIGWWLSITASLLLLSGLIGVLFAGALLVLPFAAMSLRWRSVNAGIYSVTVWNVLALSFLPGLLRARYSPTVWIDSTVLKQGAVLDEPRQVICATAKMSHFSNDARTSA